MSRPTRHTYTVGEEEEEEQPRPSKPRWRHVVWGLRFGFTLLLFLLALEWMSLGFRLFGSGTIDQLISLTGNPFLSLLLGILITAIIQSSSTVTTMVVGLVATSSLPMAAAVPLIMGANLGTSITCLIVALGLITQRKEFGRAIMTASLHGLFNLFTVLILFPIEASTQWLSRLSEGLAGWIYTASESVSSVRGLLDISTRPLARWVVDLTASPSFADGNPYWVLPLGLFSLILALRLLISSFEGVVIGQINARMNQYLFGHPRQAFLTGLVSTALLQSSSVTTSLMVPLSSSASIAQPRVFAFLLGANLGTTFTALLAAILLDASSEVGLAIAFFHLLFNCLGCLMLYPIPWIRGILMRLARELGKKSRDNRLVPLAYLILLYFLIPGLLIFLS